MNVTARLQRAGVCSGVPQGPPHAPPHPDGHLADTDTRGHSPGTCLSSSGPFPEGSRTLPTQSGGALRAPQDTQRPWSWLGRSFPVTPSWSLCPQNWLSAGHPGALGKGGELSPWNEAGLRRRSRRPCKESGYVEATQGHRGKRGLRNKPDTNAARRKDVLPGGRLCRAPRVASRGRGAENTVHARPSAGDGASAGCPRVRPRSGHGCVSA